MVAEKCWAKRCLKNKDNEIVRTNCWKVDGYELMKECFSFHDNKRKIIGGLIYLRNTI